MKFVQLPQKDTIFLSKVNSTSMYISNELETTIKELQQLDSLNSFYLAGGSNLAIRYSHRESIDIDLFCENIIGVSGFELIEKEIKETFKDRVLSITYPTKQNDELVFLRTIISTNKTNIKVEIIQGFKLFNPIELINEIRLASEIDIGLFKLDSITNRYAEKDLYDLDYITENRNHSLNKLMELYEKRKSYYIENEINTIFSLSNEYCPIENTELLILENHKKDKERIPFHSESKLKNNKTLLTYHKSNWKIKVNTYLKENK
ncbi:nucleotidyl transferase AbiEii/AbiGii toxin family protein [Flavobacterium amniphilum]|uniref:nucleotidyl transferase AbiEii/AbiGii toxin family protein n=1 Tax=Flavobacterium amniphilum TaxID=1834035 RepID=UPI00202A9950|nr:nucleotidyl transferase AbiEii/AbiGii toxin family protein [Flavobacterium amniphilum]MCL9804893.1 nucleotidyl transferase AbiEii/AbiGii toxin family protein [Flavobacterium amniphilum]